nr:hypothetical protein [Desulfogranum mediterraneum]
MIDERSIKGLFPDERTIPVELSDPVQGYQVQRTGGINHFHGKMSTWFKMKLFQRNQHNGLLYPVVIAEPVGYPEKIPADAIQQFANGWRMAISLALPP